MRIGCGLSEGRCVRHRAARRGFSIKDAVVVLVIIGVVLGVGFPAMMYMRERMRNMTCQGNLRKIGAAIDRYRSNDPSSAYPNGSGYHAADKSAGVSWWIDILPHAEGADHLPKWTNVRNRAERFRRTKVVNVFTTALRRRLPKRGLDRRPLERETADSFV